MAGKPKEQPKQEAPKAEAPKPAEKKSEEAPKVEKQAPAPAKDEPKPAEAKCDDPDCHHQGLAKKPAESQPKTEAPTATPIKK